MHHQKVDSSHIKSVGYDAVNRELEIKFQNDAVYCYHGVPQDEHRRLMACPSTGQYFHSEIKDRYPSEQRE